MRRALTLAERGAGAVSPNPLVGAIVVGEDGTVLGEGWHGQYGGPHAEVWAVRDVERRHGATALRSSTLYVTLEPCSHFGKTPPCADLIVEKGIPRVVVGMIDPFPAVAGRGIERLRAHGVEVTVGVLEQACKRLNEAFVHHVMTGRPLVTLKIAQTLDGSVATASGDSRWVTGEAARTLVHRWRAELDGVLVGRGTAAADDPALTVRHVEGRQPVRVVLDRKGTLRPDLKLFTDEHAAQTVAVVGEGVTADVCGGVGGARRAHSRRYPSVTDTSTSACSSTDSARAWGRTGRCSRSSSRPGRGWRRRCCGRTSRTGSPCSSRPNSSAGSGLWITSISDAWRMPVPSKPIAGKP